MKLRTVLKLMEKYQQCPDCGSDTLGNDKGEITVGENCYERSCSCGFRIRVDAEDNVIEWEGETRPLIYKGE